MSGTPVQELQSSGHSAALPVPPDSTTAGSCVAHPGGTAAGVTEGHEDHCRRRARAPAVELSLPVLPCQQSAREAHLCSRLPPAAQPVEPMVVPALPVSVAAPGWQLGMLDWSGLSEIQRGPCSCSPQQSAAISQTGLALAGCARARAEGSGAAVAVSSRQGDVAGCRQGSTSPQFTLLCSYSHTQKIEGCFLCILLKQNGTAELSAALSELWELVLGDSRAEWDIQSSL